MGNRYLKIIHVSHGRATAAAPKKLATSLQHPVECGNYTDEHDPIDSATCFVAKSARRRLQTVQQYFHGYYQNFLDQLNQRNTRQQPHDTNVVKDQHSCEQIENRDPQDKTQVPPTRQVRLSLSDFQLLSQIGQGGYGQVYLAQKTDTGEMCAVKKMNKQMLHKLNEVQHVLTERDVLTTSTSPWLVKLFYAFQDTEHLYLAMEYVPGGDLRTLLNHRGILRVKNARFYFAEMVTAVDALHQLGYIHRDLKPENFLIDATGHIKLTDFGLSNGTLSQAQIETIREKFNSTSNHLLIRRNSKQKRNLQLMRRQNLSRAFSTVGSPDYMAPEVLTAIGGYDHVVDYWSLGCVLYEFLAGHAPFTGATTDEVWNNVRHWKKVLERPKFNNPSININFTDDAWHLITQLITHRECRLSSLDSIKKHPFFRTTEWEDLRSHKVPFVPKLSAPDDNTYFDDFTNPADMAAYKDVLQRQAYIESVGGNAANPSHITFIGFTFRHRPTNSLIRSHIDSTTYGMASSMIVEEDYAEDGDNKEN
ncbi:kinase-like domain-containing protein [Syncephalis fuscata]|nr:kinase-like domain-containing protein [Syncephalis fuscata]